MASSWTQRELSTRAIVALVACLLLLQSLAFALSPHDRRAVHAGAEAASVAVDLEICRPDAQRAGDEDPTQAPRHADQCCVLCAAAGRDSAALAVFLEAVAEILTPTTEAIPLAPIVDDAHGRPKGWATSWSSRAPPIST